MSRAIYCGADVSEKYEVDHVAPVILGGSSNPENIVIACVRCNRSKGGKLVHEWISPSGQMFML